MTSRLPGFGGFCAAVVVVVACQWPAAASAQARQTRAEEDRFHRAATRALAHGARDEAQALAAERDAGDPSAAALLARLDILRGEYAAAEDRLAPVAAEHPISAAGLELALLHRYLGRRDAAAARLRVLVDRLQRSPDAVDLYRAARAARALGRYRQANALLRNAAGTAPDDPAIQTLWGDLFGEKYDQAEASQSYRAALEIDEDWAPALLGMARALADTNPPGAVAAAGRAIEIDPDYLDAHLFLAQRSLDDRDHEAGRASLGRALAINERSLEARSLVAAIAYVEDRLDDFEPRSSGCSRSIRPTARSTGSPATSPPATTGSRRRRRWCGGGWRSTRPTRAAMLSWACTCSARATSRGRGGLWNGRSRRTRTTSSPSTCWRCSTPSTGSRRSRRAT